MNRLEKWAIWGTASLTAVTGLGFFWAKYLASTDDPWAVINHPLQPWFLKAHILVVPLFIFAIGAVSLRHFWAHWANGVLHGRTSGALAALTVAPLILTGYLVQVITHEFLLSLVAITHIVLGMVFVGGMLIHQLFIRRARAPRDVEGTIGLHRDSGSAKSATPSDAQGEPRVGARGGASARSRKPSRAS
jgi:hypothetical protein